MSVLTSKARRIPRANAGTDLTPTPPPADDTRTRILEATHLLVGESGFEGTSIRDIARRSGTNPALVYYYFQSKEGLFAALAHHNADRAGAILREAAALTGTPRERIRHFLLIWMQALCQSMRPLAPWFRKAIQEPGEIGDVLRGRVEGNMALLAGILEDGIASGQLRRPGISTQSLATGIMVSIAGLAMEMFLPHGKTGVDISSPKASAEFVDGMLDAWFSGLEAKEGPKSRNRSARNGTNPQPPPPTSGRTKTDRKDR
jgi:AcrR family transcriptional regulator